MKYLCVLSCVLAVQGFAVEKLRAKRESGLPTPSFTSLQLLSPVQVKLEWTAVKNSKSEDPTYTLKVWEIQKINSYKLEIGVEKIVHELKPANKNFDIPPGDLGTLGRPTWEYRTNKTEYVVDNLKNDTGYKFTVQAFTKTEQSAMSSPDEIYIHKN